MKKGETKKPDGIWMDEESLVKVSEGIKDKVIPTKTGGPSFPSGEAKRR